MSNNIKLEEEEKRRRRIMESHKIYSMCRLCAAREWITTRATSGRQQPAVTPFSFHFKTAVSS